MRVQALIALKADFPVPVLLQVAGLARSTYFYHQARLQAPDPHEALKAALRGSSRGTMAATGTAGSTLNWSSKAGRSRRRPC